MINFWTSDKSTQTSVGRGDKVLDYDEHLAAQFPSDIEDEACYKEKT